MIRGQRFELDLEDDAADAQVDVPIVAPFVGDVLERQPTAAKPPSAPTRRSATGFPGHQKRSVDSRFKKHHAGLRSNPQPAAINPGLASVDLTTPTAPPPGSGEVSKPQSWVEEEKRRIDDENRQQLAAMSPEQIREEREELLSSLSPAFIERLLKRSNIDSGSNEGDVTAQAASTSSQSKVPDNVAKKSVRFSEPSEDLANVIADENEVEAPTAEPLNTDSIHFPRPPQPPELDPSSVSFLDDLHQKYFPSLPADPDKLDWMRPVEGISSSYNPLAAALNAKDLRFSFTGELLAPKTASIVPVTAGLHHHGDAPDAAGYTIAELAHLSRSSYAAQRCIAFQTLGRLLYRLGKGEFGNAGEPGVDTAGAGDGMGELARGLWREVEKEKVIETLILEADGRGVDGGRHLSAKTYAIEAVHLWRKSGGRRWRAT
ncbi:hypothetical protein BAUCODRAFT_30424 [Baudoinia panamericana UAMH 10762]|uniref:RNA polymerase II-associated protein 1 C-terminal domain-containing protein n=1 Tax=Baudoinia panamericana (strain UAMH 10762) TaxID=717646 RepID=M2NLH2_BAUPA|nr:uncharacterized protein BAUCODRAFT_30424 [Baudoinia panamericana UAMH 10762]EMC99990.1 hypothetical protein BAUCODRAFT_30424 [Baudoinia panamericana UAMH 10762]